MGIKLSTRISAGVALVSLLLLLWFLLAVKLQIFPYTFYYDVFDYFTKSISESALYDIAMVVVYCRNLRNVPWILWLARMGFLDMPCTGLPYFKTWNEIDILLEINDTPASGNSRRAGDVKSSLINNVILIDSTEYCSKEKWTASFQHTTHQLVVSVLKVAY